MYKFAGVAEPISATFSHVGAKPVPFVRRKYPVVEGARFDKTDEELAYNISPVPYDVLFVPPLEILKVPELILLALRVVNPEPVPICVPEKVPPVIVPDKVGLTLMTMFPVPVFVSSLSLLSVPELILLALRVVNPDPEP